MKLSYQGIQDKQGYAAAQVALPQYDWAKMAEKTAEKPVWVHFGAGNIFRGFIAGLQQRLLNAGLAESGIVAAETFDYDIIDKIYVPHDSMTLMVSLKADGSTQKEVIASIAKGIKANCADEAQWQQLTDVFTAPSLQMASFTITEKGYALRNMKGELMPVVVSDMENGPKQAHHAMAVVAAMLYARYQAGAMPIAMVSMDNCSHNGEKLRASVMEIVAAWVKNGLVPADFEAYVNDEARVSFPWSMIDKITPRPAEIIEKQLMDAGFEDMQPVITSRNTYIAPFVNAEVPQYLVVEDRFPNGRPALDKAGVYLCDRKTVNDTERMKVTTCLNPLHTALAVYGCLLGYTSIAAEMKDAELVKLVKTIGYKEGLPVVTDPGIISPKAFIDEVVEQRLPNPFIPDTPQRIATDTSQKVGIRFGETIKAYEERGLDKSNLVLIPLVLAGYARYLKGIDDNGQPFEISPDPLLAELQAIVNPLEVKEGEQDFSCLKALYSRADVFGVDLYAVGLGEKIEGMVKELYAGNGAVRKTLHKYTLAR